MNDELLSVLTNAIAYEVFRHDGREVMVDDKGVAGIETTAEETTRCQAAAQKVYASLTTLSLVDDQQVSMMMAAWKKGKLDPNAEPVEDDASGG